jgi:hypothetical protein
MVFDVMILSNFGSCPSLPLLCCCSKILSQELDLHLESGSPSGLLAYVCTEICILVSRMEMSLLGSEK